MLIFREDQENLRKSTAWLHQRFGLGLNIKFHNLYKYIILDDSLVYLIAL